MSLNRVQNRLVLISFNKTTVNGLASYRVKQGGKVIGYVARRMDKPKWACLNADEVVKMPNGELRTKCDSYVYDYDSRDHAAHALTAYGKDDE